MYRQGDLDGTHIDALEFKDPEVYEGEVCVPVVVSSYPNEITVYLPRRKLKRLEALSRKGRKKIRKVR